MVWEAGLLLSIVCAAAPVALQSDPPPAHITTMTAYARPLPFVAHLEDPALVLCPLIYQTLLLVGFPGMDIMPLPKPGGARGANRSTSPSWLRATNSMACRGCTE